VSEQHGTFKSLACNRQKVTEGCRNTAKWEHENFYCLCIVSRLIKSKRTKCVEYVSCMGNMRYICSMLVAEHQEMIAYGRVWVCRLNSIG
jgi:hypothetical protein